jgi:hypothetical protein
MEEAIVDDVAMLSSGGGRARAKQREVSRAADASTTSGLDSPEEQEIIVEEEYGTLGEGGEWRKMQC